jgi:hypothetical protein
MNQGNLGRQMAKSKYSISFYFIQSKDIDWSTQKLMRSGLTNIQWCPGCGDFLIIMAIKNAFKELGIPSHKRVVVS